MRWMDARQSKRWISDGFPLRERCRSVEMAKQDLVSEPRRLQESAPWARHPNKPLGRLLPSQVATPQSSIRNLRHRALPVGHQGCHLADLLEALHVTLLCSSASYWWTVVSHCSDASPWHTHRGTATDLMPSVLFKTSFVIKVTWPAAVAASHAIVT